MNAAFQILIRSIAIVGLHMSLAVLIFNVEESKGQDDSDFAHDILPILRTHCAECHSNGTFKGGLSLESRENLIESGTIEVGSHEESDLFERIVSTDPDYQMPPEGPRLSSEQIEAVKNWIDQGLDWPEELSLKKPTFKRSLSLDTSVMELVGEAHPLDQLLASYFEQHSISWPKELDDYKFLRRAKLDLLGLMPTIKELESFKTNTNPNKREALIDEWLLRDREYADHWMSFWNDLLRNDYAGTGYIDGGRQQITKWLHAALMENEPYDSFVQKLIGPTPESYGFIKGIKWRGEVNASQIEPLQFAQNVSQVFLGINMKCASCHDSFIDDWKLEDAYGLAAIISDEPLELHRCDVPTGKMASSKFVFPELGEIDSSLPKDERLTQLSELITSRKNGRFTRAIVNRLWERMMGRGLVHPVDVMANEAWSEPLLDFLALDLIEHRYDLTRTLRLIATSRIYRSQSEVRENSTINSKYIFRGVQKKRMTAEQFVDAVWQVTGAGPDKRDAEIEVAESTSEVVRASLVNSNELMRTLGRPNREQVVTTRPAELSTLQALDLSNGALLDSWLKMGAERLLTSHSDNQWTTDELLHYLFLTTLSREPTSEEKNLFDLGESIDQQEIEDLLWIVFMLPEFQMIE